MFEKPTINDFLAQLRMRHEDALGYFAKSKLKIQSEASRRGTLQSSMTIFQMLDATEDAVRNGTAELLGELRRAIDDTDLNRDELRQVAMPRIEDLASALISAGGWSSAKRWVPSGAAQQQIDERLAKIREKVRFWIRQFDVGFDKPAKPEPLGHVTNIVHARDITGAVQQGKGSLTQTSEVHIDVQTLSSAIAVFEAELAKVELPATAREEVESDLATIKAQLRKPSPSAVVLRESGRTLRNLAEGVIAGMLTPQAVAAISHLSRALGI